MIQEFALALVSLLGVFLGGVASGLLLARELALREADLSIPPPLLEGHHLSVVPSPSPGVSTPRQEEVGELEILRRIDALSSLYPLPWRTRVTRDAGGRPDYQVISRCGVPLVSSRDPAVSEFLALTPVALVSALGQVRKMRARSRLRVIG